MPSGSSITTDQVELMERMNVVLEKQLETLIAIEQKLQGQTQITREATSAARDYTSAMDGMSTATGGLSDAFDQVGGYFDNFKDSVKKFVGSEAYERITNGLNDGLDLLQINFSSLADIVSNPVAAAMGFLTSTWDILIKKAIELWRESLRIAEGLENIRDKFGSFAEKTSRDVKSAYSSFGSSIGGVGGKFAAGADGAIEKINTMIGLAEDLGPTIDLQGTNFKKAADNLYLLKEGLGFSAEGLKQMAVFANLGGKSVKQMSQETLATINKIGKGLGISTKVLGRDVSGAISNFKFLGRMTGDYVKEVTKAAAFTRKLGIELKELTGLVDKFDEFEGGAEAAAQLAQGFGMVLDPVKMLGMEAAPRLQELQRAFAATGRSFDTMSRQERKLLADTSGLTEEQAALAFSVRGMGMSYDQISKAGDKAAESQKSTAEVAREVLDNIKNVFADIGEITGFITAFFEGFGRGFMGEGSVLSLLHKLVGGMQTVRSIGYEVGRMFATMLFRSEGAETNGKAILKIFERIGQMFVSVAGHIRTFVDELRTDPTKAMKNFLTNIFNTMESLFSGEGIDLNGMAERLGTLFLEIMTGAIEWLTDKLGEWTEKLGDLFADEKKGVAGGTESALSKALGKLTDSVPKLLEKIGPFLEALIKAIPKIIEKFPIATLFVAGGPIATALTGIAGGFFTALGGIFGTVGSSAAAAGAVATGGSAAGGTGGLTAGTTSAMTGAATAVVGQSQGILDKLFELIKEPAKITLMATAIAASIKILGEAVREVFLAFMDPLPGRPESFIDIVVKSAKKFESVSMGNLVALGATMLAVGVVIGGLVAAISYMASNLSGKQIALIAGGAGLAVAGLSLLPKGGAKGLIGTVLGNIGDLMMDIAAPFTDPTFLAGLDTMSTMSDKLSSLKATADSLKEMVTALTTLESAMPKKTFGFGKNVDDLRKGISDAVGLLIGVPGSEGIAAMLQKLPDMSNFADKTKGIGEISKAMTSLGQIVSTTSGMGDLAGSKKKILELVGENGFLSYFRVLPSWFNWAASTPLADNVIDQINSLTRALTTLKSAITALANLKISGGIMGGGATAQASELISFLPTVSSMTNSMNEQLGSLEFLDGAAVDTKIQGIEKMMSILETYADKMNRVSMSLSSRKLQQFEARVIAVVDHLRTVRTILEELPKISLDASINRLESDMQVAKQTLTLKGGAVNISVEMNVSMNAQKMADQLIIEGFVQPNMQYEQYINPTVFGQGYQSNIGYNPTSTGVYAGYAAASAAGTVGGGAPSSGGAP